MTDEQPAAEVTQHERDAEAAARAEMVEAAAAVRSALDAEARAAIDAAIADAVAAEREAIERQIEEWLEATSEDHYEKFPDAPLEWSDAAGWIGSGAWRFAPPGSDVTFNDALAAAIRSRGEATDV